MDNKAKNETSEKEIITIHDCLKMIGMKELAANVYAIPTKKKA